MRTRIFEWITITALLANLVGAGLAPRPVAAAPMPEPDTASTHVGPAWYEGLLVEQSAPKGADWDSLVGDTKPLLPSWFATDQPEPPVPVDLFPGWMTRSPSGHPPGSVQSPGPGLCPAAGKIDMILTLPPDPVSRGDTTGEVFTVTIKNTSAISIPEVSLLIDPNQGFYYLDNSASATSSLSPTLNVDDTGPGSPGHTSTITVTGDVAAMSIASGETMTFTFKLATDADAKSGQRLTVSLQSGDSPSLKNCKTVGKNVQTVRGNLVISKGPATQDGSFADEVSWTVTLRNTGLGDVYNAIFTDTKGSGLDGLTIDPPVNPITLSPESSQEYTVTATVASCENLTNTVEASWSIGNADGTGTADDPVRDAVDIVYLVKDPDVSVKVGPLPDVSYCEDLDETVVVTVTNTGGGARALRLIMATNLNVTEQDNDWIQSGDQLTYTGGTPPGAICCNQTLTFTVQVTRTNVCAAGEARLTLTPLYDDPCLLQTDVGGTADDSISDLGADAPTLNISKQGPGVVHAGETFTYIVTASGVNQQSILTGGVSVTDTVPGELSINSISATSGTSLFSGQTVTWHLPLDSVGSYTSDLSINVTVPGDGGDACGAGASFENQVEAMAHVCPACILEGEDSLTTYVEDYLGASNVFTKTASPIEPCAPGGPQVITAALRISDGITWTGTIYTDTLGTDDFNQPLNVVSDTTSPSVIIEGVDRTDDVTISLGAPLVIDFSAIGTHSDTADITITYAVTATADAIDDDAPSQTEFLFSEFRLGGDPGTACGGGSTGYVGTEVTLRRGDLSVGVSPSTLASCRENTITLTVSGARDDTETDHVVVTFTAQTDDVFTHTLASFGGAFANTTVLSDKVDSTAVFTFTALEMDEDGTISFPLFRDCDVSGPISATLGYHDRCGVSRKAMGGGGSSTTQSNVTLFATPDSYVVNERTARWRFYVSNSGGQAASEVTVTNTLPSGYSLETYAVTSTQPAVLSVITDTTGAVGGRQVVTFTIPDSPGLDPGQRVRFDVTATVTSCVSPATVDIALFQACGQVAGDCDGRQEEQVEFLKGTTSLLSSNDQTANLPLCEEGTIELTVKNTSAASEEYDFIITDVLTNATYVVDSAFVTVTNQSGDIVTGTTSGELLQGVPFTPTVTSVGISEVLTWNLTSFVSGTAPYDVLAERDASDVMLIRFKIDSDCSSREASVQSSVAARDVCNVLLTSQEDSQTLDTDEPDLAIDKKGRNATTDSPLSDGMTNASAGDTVVWEIQVTNDGNQDVFNLFVTDTVPSNVTVSETNPATTTQSPGRVTWAYTSTTSVLDAGESTTFIISGTVDYVGCSLSTTNTAEANYGCSSADVCLADPVTDTAELRTRPLVEIQDVEGSLSTCGGVITITLNNDGPPAQNVTLTDTLPSAFVYQATVFSTTAPSTFPVLGSSVPTWTWTSPISLPNGTTTIAFRVSYSQTTGSCSDPGTSVSNQVDLSYEDTCTGTDPYTATWTDDLDVTRLTLVADKSPEKQISDVGQDVAWTLTVKNNTSAPAPNVVITDVVGSAFSNVTATVGSTGVDSNTPVVVGNTITWTPAITIPANGAWTATVTGTAGATGVNTNSVEAVGVCAAGCVYSTTSDLAVVTLVREFVKLPEVQTDTIGSVVTFTLKGFASDADTVYQNVTFTDTLPQGLGYLSSVLTYTYDADASSVTVISNTPTITQGHKASGDVVWRLGDLSGTVQMTASLTAVILDVFSNQDGVTLTNVFRGTWIDEDQPFEGFDTSQVDIVEPDVDLSKDVASSTESLSDLDGAAFLTYTLRLTNTGTSPAYDVVITDAVPSGISVTHLYGGESRSGPIQGQSILTWTVGVMSDTLPGMHNPLVLSYTARISGAVASGDETAERIDLTNLVSGTYSSLPGEPPPGEERDYGPVTDTKTVDTASAALTKSVEPPSSASGNLRIGDVVTYTIVDEVPPGLAVPWPYHYDYLPVGFRYITGTFAVHTNLPVAGSSLTDTLSSPYVSADADGDTGVEGPTATDNPNVGPKQGDDTRQAVEWWLQTLDNAGRDAKGYVTITFQAQILGVDLQGTSVWTNTLDQLASQRVTNTARLLWNMEDAGAYTKTLPANELLDDAESFVGQPNLSIDKDSTPLPDAYIGANNLVTYTLTITNNGHTPAYDVVISDTLPAGLSYITSTIASTVPPTIGFTHDPSPGTTGDLSWQINELWGTDLGGVARTAIMTVVAQVTDTIGANLVLTNVAAIDYYDSQPSDGPSTGLTPMQREYEDGDDSVQHRTVDGKISKAVTPDEATLGDVITYTIRVPDPVITVTLHAVTVTDALDARLQLQSVSDGPDGTVVQMSNAFTVTYPSIPHGEQRVITATAVVSSPLGAGAGDVITNVAVLEHRDGGPTLSNEPPFTVTEPSLTLVKTSDPPDGSQVGAGAPVTYTVRITNSNWITSSDAYDIVIRDTLPSGMDDATPTVVGLTIDGVGVTNYTEDYSATPDFVVTLPPAASIPPGGTLLITYTTQVDSGVAAAIMLTNWVSATWSSLPGDVPGDRDYGPVTDTTTLHTGDPVLDLTKASQPSVADPGGLLTYTVTVSNEDTNPVDATNVVITDVTPLHTAFFNAAGGDSIEYPDVGNTGVVTWHMGTVVVGTSEVVTLVVQVDDPFPEGEVITNTARVDSAEGITDSQTISNPVSASLGDQVWFDVDADGVQDPGEPGVAGVTVNLYDASGAPTDTTTTDATGIYTFSQLMPGDYNVEFVLPDGYVFSPQNQGGDDTVDSDADPATGEAQQTTLVSGEHDPDWDAGIYLPASLGNYVWLDENNDGYQDAGEAGIPNVIIVLTDTLGNVTTTTTDAKGGYLFTGLVSGTYTVTVAAENFDPGGALEGMSQTTNPVLGGADFGNQSQPYTVTLGPGEENLTADFGYNWNPDGDVNGNKGQAVLGDRIWIDADGDGAQDPHEVGIAGVQLELYSDPDGDGIYDSLVGTTTTDANGHYIFDGLDPGAYVVEVVTTTLPAGYNQTGDPDHFGTTGVNDNVTTSPVVLGPGDVFLDVDFGYQPPTGEDNAIGDTIWFDADADGSYDPGKGEYGIPGVTVALIEDTNGDGDWQPGEPIIGSDTTDAGGTYLFEGLPDGDYIVWVNDTDNVLGELVQSGDPDAVLDDLSSVQDLGVNDSGSVQDLDQDFGYTPPAHDPSDGLIGDTIFLDVDGDDIPDAGEGLEGVEVILTDSQGVTRTTITNETGNYSFGNLPAGTYTVTVTTNTLPPGVSNSVDPDGGFDSVSVVTIGNDQPLINLDQDFGYVADVPGRIGNLIWLDSNADGVFDLDGADGVLGTDDDEPPIGGVTVDLYRDLDDNGQIDPGEPLIASTVSSGTIDQTTFYTGGNYIFEGLPAGDYVVDVTDEDGVLAGYWHSRGTDGVNNNSQADPYPVSIGAGGENLTADFGYYVEPAAVGNFVWDDLNGDGIQDTGEPGIEDVQVTLTIAYPDSTVISLTTRTDANGHYAFDNLLLDEDYNGDGTASEPDYTISVETPAGYERTLVDVGGASDREDSDDHDGVGAQPVQGQTDVDARSDPNGEPDIASYDFGFYIPASLGNYVWEDLDHDGIQNDGDTGLNGVSVGLYRDLDGDGVAEPGGADNGAVSTTLTANDPGGHPGYYTFTNLAPGDYFVVFTPTVGYTFTLQNIGADTADSDADPISGVAAVTTLTSGENDPTWDAGLYTPADLGITKESEPVPYRAGQSLTYTLVVTNVGPLVARDVVVSDTLDPNVNFVSGSVQESNDPDVRERDCTYVSPTVTCDLHKVDVGERVTITIVTTVTVGFRGVLRNTALVAAASFDPNAGNNAAAHQNPLTTPVGGVTMPVAGFALLARWLELLGLVLLAGGVSLLGCRRRIGR